MLLIITLLAIKIKLVRLFKLNMLSSLINMLLVAIAYTVIALS